MYIRPMDTQPVSIFVTGFVPRPGNYTGTPSDTILAFLELQAIPLLLCRNNVPVGIAGRREPTHQV